MRSVSLRSAPRSPWILAAALSFPCAACGGSDEPKSTATAAVPPAETTPRPAASAPGAPTVEIPLDGTSFTPLVEPVEGPIEYEEAADKPLVANFPENGTPEVERPAIELPSDDAILGKPLVINGKVIPFDVVKREICLGQLGVAEIEQAKVNIFLKEEIQRRVQAGASLEDLAVGDDELDTFVQELDEQLKTEYPDGSMTMEDVYASLSSVTPKERLRVTRLFEKLMLPEDPSQFPPVTIEAILKHPGGDSVLEHCKTTFEERQKDNLPKVKGIAERSVDDLVLQQIHEHLLSVATLVRDPAPGVLYRVNDVDITVDQIWERINPLLTAMEVRSAKQWIVNHTLLKDAFVAAGAWLSDEEAEAEYGLHSDPYKESLFSQERIALVVKRFPSVDRYKEYRRLYDSFYELKKPELTEDVLQKQADFRTKKIVGQVTVDADVLLCSAFDQKTNRWKENGWVEAENRMRDVLNLLVEEQRPWEELVERYSDFYEPPVAVSERDQVDPSLQREKGRFRNYQRNNFLSEIGESEYGLFLNGSSITDFIFFEQEVGTLGQPMRGPLGWYLPRLIRRSKPPLRVPMAEESMKALVLDDYLSWNLMTFAQELIQKNEVYGLETAAQK